MRIDLLIGDCAKRLKELPSNSVHCAVTSPPYFRLRDYGVDGQIGSEQTPAEYVNNLVSIFREMRRVLRDDGVFWLNLGDSWNSSAAGNSKEKPSGFQQKSKAADAGALSQYKSSHRFGGGGKLIGDVKAKDLFGIPWQVAFALRADGWWLRSEVIWHKVNGLPESTDDRVARGHETVFMLTKSPKYFFDDKAIMVPASPSMLDYMDRVIPDDIKTRGKRGAVVAGAANPGSVQKHIIEGKRQLFGQMKTKRDPNEDLFAGLKDDDDDVQSDADVVARTYVAKYGDSYKAKRIDSNVLVRRRSVWRIANEPVRDEHFATFPTKLVRICLTATCPQGGTVLDPFAGSGTVGIVAEEMGRNAILIELNPKYIQIEGKRINNEVGLMAERHTFKANERYRRNVVERPPADS